MTLLEIHGRLTAAPRSDHAMFMKWIDALIADLDDVIDGHKCEHGVRDGDWCEPCNRERKEARRANGDDPITCGHGTPIGVFCVSCADGDPDVEPTR